MMTQQIEAGQVCLVAQAPAAGDAEFLRTSGRQVRKTRERRGMTRKLVARDSGVSERHLVHLEGGEGNVSVILLRHDAFNRLRRLVGR